MDLTASCGICPVTQTRPAAGFPRFPARCVDPGSPHRRQRADAGPHPRLARGPGTGRGRPCGSRGGAPRTNPAELTNQKLVVIALAGQPNVRESTALTHSRDCTSMWATGPGSSRNHSGELIFQQTVFTLVDLPGTYSLTAASEEERSAAISPHEKPDLVVAVVNATNLERGLPSWPNCSPCPHRSSSR